MSDYNDDYGYYGDWQDQGDNLFYDPESTDTYDFNAPPQTFGDNANQYGTPAFVQEGVRDPWRSHGGTGTQRRGSSSPSSSPSFYDDGGYDYPYRRSSGGGGGGTRQSSGGFYSGGGGGGFNSEFFKKYEDAYAAAKAANEKRYGEILSGYDKQYASLEGAGKQEGLDISERWKNANTQGQQGLVSSGLSSTTVAPTLAAGYVKREGQDQSRLQERIQQQRLGIDTNRLNFMERRDDVYPDLNLYATLAKNMGSGGVGMGGGGQAAPAAPAMKGTDEWWRQQRTGPRKAAGSYMDHRQSNGYYLY